MGGASFIGAQTRTFRIIVNVEGTEELLRKETLTFCLVRNRKSVVTSTATRGVSFSASCGLCALLRHFWDRTPN
jgi:hypothetical protein